MPRLLLVLREGARGDSDDDGVLENGVSPDPPRRLKTVHGAAQRKIHQHDVRVQFGGASDGSFTIWRRRDIETHKREVFPEYFSAVGIVIDHKH